MIGRTTSSRVASLLLVLVPLIVLSQSTVASQIPVTLTTTYAETHTSTNYVATPVASYTYRTTEMAQLYSGSLSIPGVDRASGYCYYRAVLFVAQVGDSISGSVHFPPAADFNFAIMNEAQVVAFQGRRIQAFNCGGLFVPLFSAEEYYDDRASFEFIWGPRSSGAYYFVMLNGGINDITGDFTASRTRANVSPSTQYLTQTTLVPYTISSTSVYTTQLLYTSNGELLLIGVISLVALVMAAVLFRIRRRKPRQASIGHLMKPTCVNCGAELPLNSKFCKECGAKQP